MNCDNLGSNCDGLVFEFMIHFYQKTIHEKAFELCVCRSERLAKYNQLLRIEEELGDKAVYAGASFRAPVAPY